MLFRYRLLEKMYIHITYHDPITDDNDIMIIMMRFLLILADKQGLCRLTGH